jgi:choice-of-anchor A domain-containing protein
MAATGWVACSVDLGHQDAPERQHEGAPTEVCQVRPPFTPNFEPELEWEWTGSTVLPDYNHVIMTPVVVDLDGNGVPDIVFNTSTHTGPGFISEPGVMRAISGNGGHDLWTVTDPALQIRAGAQIAAGDIDGDGRVELCTVPASGEGIICFEHDGAFKFRSSGATNVWGGPSMADLDGDGSVEILDGNRVYSNTGALKWVGIDDMGGIPAFGGVGTISFAADIDGDGSQEVINDRAVYRADGTLKCRNIDIGHGLAGVGNFDADARGEIVVVWSGHVSLLDDDCTLRWTANIPGGGNGGAPNIADFDGDGQPEIGVAGAVKYAVFETDGSLKWAEQTRDVTSNVTGSSTFDFEGDGRAEVVYADEKRLRIYDGATGRVRFDVPHSSCTAYENPVVADVDGDDNAEIIVAENSLCSSVPDLGPYKGIRVFRDRRDGWVNTRSIWNQHAYSVTNVNDDGTIPSHPATNWTTPGLNTFRSNSQGAGSTHPFAAPDVVVPHVAAVQPCVDGELTLSATVLNQGAAAVSLGMPVAFYSGDPAAGGTLLGVVALDHVLAPGQSAAVPIAVVPTNQSVNVYVVADDDGNGHSQETECREDNNTASAWMNLSCSSPECIEVRLSDYNLFLLEDYSGGHDVQGKVAAGGNISLADFVVGAGVQDNDVAHVLVAGGDLSLTRGGVWGGAWYGRNYTTDPSVTFARGSVSQGTPIDFAARGASLRSLSARLAGLTINGTTTREVWGGIMLRGTDPNVNVFQVNASAFTGATLLSIAAPAGSLAVVNIHGSTATFTGFDHSFSGGIDQHGVLYNFVDATAINAQGYGFWGTVLAPYAHVSFSNGSWDGGLYAKSMMGNAEGHINPLHDRDICQ